ncbi:hypothetical protein A2cp1_1634 [Anaeromyxobacter dehalogenans 2CP-1]|uniref:Uncharacterized protein n=1 Tax=Anaeromyxobacter dehalogenans (strain ATCC BAA-258 / DSM 21875 / 2CP-1) TaxID=455488 RepID=B8J5N1_ANAD2|nr:hypothetical protein [Anaeromyxobacter dehalogenans]ACL64978.1 hypothetical protein A2cp1_1634 [Anaeromyxobacter dehalogenans 2CP-1]
MRIPLVALLSILGLCTVGCEDEACQDVNCSPCPRSGDLTITDSVSSGVVPGAAVSGGSVTWACTDAGGATRCTTGTEQLPDAVFSVTVTAPGYVSQDVQLTPVEGAPGKCCAGCITYSPSVVALVRAP